MYTDPSGHNICDEDGYCYDHGKRTGRVLGGSYDPDSLSPGGKDMYNLYIWYRNNPGWWNNYGESDLSVYDFAGMMITYELAKQGFDPNARDLVTEAAGRQLWMDISSWIKENGATGRTPYFCSVNCSNGVLNWLAARVQTSQSRSNTYKADPDNYNPGAPPPAGMTNAINIGKELMSPDSSWKHLSPWRPYTWGNEGTPDKWNTSLRGSFNQLPNNTVLGFNSIAWYKTGNWDFDPTTNSAFAILSLDQTELLTP